MTKSYIVLAIVFVITSIFRCFSHKIKIYICVFRTTSKNFVQVIRVRSSVAPNDVRVAPPNQIGKNGKPTRAGSVKRVGVPGEALSPKPKATPKRKGKGKGKGRPKGKGKGRGNAAVASSPQTPKSVTRVPASTTAVAPTDFMRTSWIE